MKNTWRVSPFHERFEPAPSQRISYGKRLGKSLIFQSPLLRCVFARAFGVQKCTYVFVKIGQSRKTSIASPTDMSDAGTMSTVVMIIESICGWELPLTPTERTGYLIGARNRLLCCGSRRFSTWTRTLTRGWSGVVEEVLNGNAIILSLHDESNTKLVLWLLETFLREKQGGSRGILIMILFFTSGGQEAIFLQVTDGVRSFQFREHIVWKRIFCCRNVNFGRGPDVS